MKNIILIGFMGCGKTSVGKRLAEHIGYQFSDTDELIEAKEKRTISSIFESNGEEYFRDCEEKLLLELKEKLESTVLSTGGGLPLREGNRRLLRELGIVVYLRASVETTIFRVQNDSTRPLLAGEDLEKRVTRLLNLRKPIYEACAHITIDTDGLDFQAIIDKIIDAQKIGGDL